MADDKIDSNLPQQRYLGASAAGVVGSTVPGAPTSLSCERLSEVCEAGTSVQLVTVEDEESSLRKAVDRKNDPNPRSLEGSRSIENILRDIDEKYTEDSPPEGVVGTSFDADKETFFGDSPPPDRAQEGTERMEVAREEVTNKKRKADSSPVIGSSSESCQRLRRAYLIEIMDKEGSGKAKALQERLRALFTEEQATVACPVTFGEMRFVGLDDTILLEEVVQFIITEGNCDKEDVKVGRIQPMRNGLNTVWVRCPLVAATAIASRKKVRMGWTFVKVELLKTKPTQCFKCWGYGHVRYACKSDVDRSRSCFNCGEEDHPLRDCKLSPDALFAWRRKGGVITGWDLLFVTLIRGSWKIGLTSRERMSRFGGLVTSRISDDLCDSSMQRESLLVRS